MEGKLRQIANPHSEKRMELILQQLEVSGVQVYESESDECDDEVCFMYYGETCECSKTQCVSLEYVYVLLEDRIVQLSVMLILKLNVPINK